MKSLAILGSTGSVGTNALAVASHCRSLCRVRALAAGSNWRRLARQIAEHRPARAALSDERAFLALRRAGGLNGTRLYCGADGLQEVIRDPDVNWVLVAITGAAGLPASLGAAEAGKPIALANKESLVMAGPLLTAMARAAGVPILPVDSEHSAIFQSLHSGRREEIRRIILTASGGPFRTTPRAAFRSLTPEAALRHPTWKMGPKITIDSATLMNKAMEIVEARWLFDLAPDRISVVIHPQSVVHSMVEFLDGSVIAQLGVPDMTIPIQYALTYPDRSPGLAPRLTFERAMSLTFEPPDRSRFPALDLGDTAARAGGTCGAVLNAANEIAVAAFLEGRIRFPEITSIVARVLSRHRVRKSPSIDDIFAVDAWARTEAQDAVARTGRSRIHV
ncbi:MAG: 1-deoxy-D-xylulose-5-phosphate reductoisomerase [Planctomycetes bacterium]|nr:1-deoxy-D-xylulose-5-phosphate reductoisomerase [Planctomycetota bacterium]